MSVANHRYGHGFIHVPKTAGTSMEKFDFIGASGHSTVADLRRRGDGLWWWGFVRHPADRLLSAFSYIRQYSKPTMWPGIRGIKTIDKFVDWLDKRESADITTLPMTHFLCVNGIVAVDFVGKYENLDNDWRIVLDRIGMPYSPLPKQNATKHKPWQEVFSADQLRVIERVYRDDYETFGYEMEG